jgi:hypothetical protein
MKHAAYFFCVLGLFTLLPGQLSAQFDQPAPPDVPETPQDMPIDGGLSLLLAAGAAYGIKKYRDNKKDAQD